jgi:hypothetical protein
LPASIFEEILCTWLLLELLTRKAIDSASNILDKTKSEMGEIAFQVHLLIVLGFTCPKQARDIRQKHGGTKAHPMLLAHMKHAKSMIFVPPNLCACWLH